MARDSTTRLAIGILPAVFLKVLGGGLSFTNEETDVLAAMRRSSRQLEDASVDEMAEYVRGMTPEQLAGFHNNVKGIYHELRYVARENADGDDLQALTYELMNHPGADVLLVNSRTGETVDIQLKATDSVGYVREHQDRFLRVEVHATEEAAISANDVSSSGFRNAELVRDVDTTLEKLTDDGNEVLEAATVSGLLSGVVHARAALRGERSGTSAVRRVIEDLGIGAGSAAVLELLLG